MRNNKKPQDNGQNVNIAVVGTLNWVETAASLCALGGLEAKAFKLYRYRQAIRFLLSRDFRKADALYQVGAGGIKYLIAARIFCKPLIKHWIGSDAYDLSIGRGWKHRLWVSLYKRCVALHLADSPEVSRLVENVGIHPEVVRLLPPELLGQVLPLPEKFTVLGYWQDDDIEKYGGHHILRLAREFPDIHFLIVGASGRNVEASPNVTFLGFQRDMTEVFRQTSVFVRIPSHDSISALALEMLSRGRYVIYTHPLPGSIYVDSYAAASKALQELQGKREPNTAAVGLIRENYDPKTQAKRLNELICEKLNLLPNKR
jgi:glycosyltransferase involved in cell wall biosynthesis